MIPGPSILAGVLLFVVSVGGAYVGGRMDGQKIEVAAQVKAEHAAEKQRQQDQAQIDASATRAQEVEQNRQANVREIYRESTKLVDRPVYSNVCVDADGVRAIQRAADNANGKGVAAPSSATAGAAGTAADDGRGDDGQAGPPGVP